MPEKRIGFFDYRLDNFHANVYLSAIRGPLAERGYCVSGATGLMAEACETWCDANDVPFFSSVGQLASEVDFLAILAPSNPELHLEMCRQAFALSKPTFVDKTFAPDTETARSIFACADENEIPIQTTSALRTTNVQSSVASLSGSLLSMIVDSSGPTFAEYGIHPFELAISCMGADVSSFSRIGTTDVQQYVMVYSDSRTAIVNFHESAELPYSAKLFDSQGCQEVVVETDRLFVDAAASILDFFDAGKPLIDRRETLVIRELMDLAADPRVLNQFVEVGTERSKQKTVAAPHWQRSLQSASTPQLDGVQTPPDA